MLCMVGRVWRPERHGGSIPYSCSVHWTSLAPADSVLRTCLRFTSPQSQHLSRGRGARAPSVAWSDGSGDPNDTRACRLHNRCMVKQYCGSFSQRTTAADWRGHKIRGQNIRGQKNIKKQLGTCCLLLWTDGGGVLSLIGHKIRGQKNIKNIKKRY